MRFLRTKSAVWEGPAGRGVADAVVVQDIPSQRFTSRAQSPFKRAKGPRLHQRNALRPRVRLTLMGEDNAVLERWYPTGAV